MSQINEPKDLDWKVVVLIPEADIVGSVDVRQLNRIVITILIAITGSILGFALLNIIIKPVTKSAKVASAFAEGNWDVQMKQERIVLKETTELVTAFNAMALSVKNSFEKLKLSEEKYRTLIENVDSMIYSMNPKGIILSVNSTFEKFSGFQREELLGRSLGILFQKEENNEQFQEMLKMINEKKERVSFNFEYRDKKNKRIIFVVSFIPMLDEEGNLDIILGTNLDITELSNAQDEIRHLHEIEKENLQRLVDEKTEELRVAMHEIIEMEKYASLGGLVSGVAHEINTPLGVAVTTTSYIAKINQETIQLLQDGKMTKSHFIKYIEAMEETADILEKNLNRAADLVKNFKQMAVNQSIEEKTSFYLYDFIQSLLVSLKHEYKYIDIQFEINCSKELIVNSYSGSFSQIFTNLIMNSLKHGLKGLGGIIKIEAEIEEEALIIKYSDNGVGISKDNLKRIFEPFFTTYRNKGGSGLGLSIVYNIVTGQLGEAPEEKVIKEYDINDYWLKTELTVNRLKTTLFSTLRSYRDIMTIEKNRKGLERIIEASAKLFAHNSLNEFLTSILHQLSGFYQENTGIVYIRDGLRGGVSNGFVTMSQSDSPIVVAATGSYEKHIGKDIRTIEELIPIYKWMDEHPDNDLMINYIGNGFIVRNSGVSGQKNYIFVEGNKEICDFDLIKLFLSNYSIAFDNYILNNMISTSQKEIILILGEIAEKHFDETGSHVNRVSTMMYNFAARTGLPHVECEKIRLASILHDIGKIGIPDSVLKKPGKLTEDEFEIIKEHTQIGSNILSGSDLDILKIAAEIALNHHEKYDGAGYPNGIKREDIPISARMLAIVDVYDAMSHKRVYKDAKSPEEALEYISEQKGMHFDGKLVDTFLQYYREIILDD